jgi:hypothetical protein
MKKCNHCGVFKQHDEFYFRYKRLGIRSPTCKKCKAKFDRNYYQGRKEEHKETTKLQKAERRKVAQQFIINYLRDRSCVDCGERDIRVLEFDHVRGTKKMAISRMVANGYAIQSIQKELSKCEVRCGNCHRIKTTKERGWFRR